MGVFNLNANAQDFHLYEDGEDTFMTQITTGGIIDLYFAFEGKVEKVQKLMRRLLGKPVLPPKWAFGWAQSRYGYNSTADMEEIHNSYTSNNIPYDA